MSHQKYLADFSLAVVNRTGAYFICKEIVDSLPDYFEAVRYWRFFRQNTPVQNLALKVMARAMMAEIRSLRGSNVFQWPVPSRLKSLPKIFFDPLYVLRCRLDENDIVLCHDVGPVSHQDLFSGEVSRLYQEAYLKIKACGPGMVFVSNASKTAFADLYGDDYRFMKSVRLFTRIDAVDGPEEPVAGIEMPFTVSVGALEKRKNYERIIDAFAASGLADKGYSHVICGPRGHGNENILNAAENTKGVHMLGRVSDAQLRWLYNKAEGFVLPSLLEGFGVPAIEASYKGLVSVVSAGTAQEEAIGGNGLCVDPLSVDQIAESFRRLIDMSAEEKRTISEKAASFARSWTVEDYRNAWRQILATNGLDV